MHKLTASFLGRDCPGVVSAVASLMEKAQCNIIEVSQTILTGEFAAIFIVTAPAGLDDTALSRHLQLGLAEAKVDLSVLVRPTVEGCWATEHQVQPFVVTVDGPDKVGLIAGMSRIFGQFQVNIEHLKAVLGEDGPNQALFLFEVMVPVQTDMPALRASLTQTAHQLGMRVTVQHRDIFEAVHRVLPV